VTLNLEEGKIKAKSQEYHFPVPSSQMLQIYYHQGLLNMIRKEKLYAE